MSIKMSEEDAKMHSLCFYSAEKLADSTQKINDLQLKNLEVNSALINIINVTKDLLYAAKDIRNKYESETATKLKNNLEVLHYLMGREW